MISARGRGGARRNSDSSILVLHFPFLISLQNVDALERFRNKEKVCEGNKNHSCNQIQGCRRNYAVAQNMLNQRHKEHDGVGDLVRARQDVKRGWREALMALPVGTVEHRMHRPQACKAKCYPFWLSQRSFYGIS